MNSHRLILSIATIFILHQNSLQAQDKSCLKPSFDLWKSHILSSYDSLTFKKYNTYKYLATNFWLVKDAIKILVDTHEMNEVYCKIFRSVSDSINWDHSTIVIHNIRRGGTMKTYIMVAFSKKNKTLGRFYNTANKSYRPLNSLDFFRNKYQRRVLSAQTFTSNGFLIISKFDQNLNPYFTKVLVGPWYYDLEPLLRIYYSE